MFDYQKYFDWVSENGTTARNRQKAFHNQLIDLHRHHIPSGSTVIEWGCGNGELLNALDPQRGLGIDISQNMIAKANTNSGNCEYRQGDLHNTRVDEKFKHIVCSYLTGYLEDIQKCLENLKVSADSSTRLYISSLNSVWHPILSLGQSIGSVVKQPPSNWLALSDLVNLLELSGWEVITKSSEQLLPYNIPIISEIFNRWLVRLPFFRHFGSTLFIVARPKIKPVFNSDVSCSVIVPARNEAGNIKAALDRIPTLGKQTEIIFVEGNSNDNTWDTIQNEVKAYKGPHKVSYCQQPGKGKWDAVFCGFSKAVGDVLVIQDGDLTAPPEDLPKFFDAVANGHTEFANGSRLVYPMEDNAMRFLNFMGNKFFALSLSAVIKQPIKDSLCGTKMISRKNYDQLLIRIKLFGDFDPFGDFNLLFGSSLLDLKIRDIPVRYKDRTYGDTNISRFKHGWILLKMTVFGLRHLRFHQ